MIFNYIENNFHKVVFWGIVLQIAGAMMQPIASYTFLRMSGWIIWSAGTMLLLAGFAFYAKSKGRHSAWCILALISVIGWIVLIMLKDKSHLQT